MDRPTIALIGTGNVASHLAPALDCIADVSQIYSRHLDNAVNLARKLRNCQAIECLDSLNVHADFCIICVADQAISDIASRMPNMHGIVVHTSGSIPIDVLSAISPNIGVLYPLQTFSKNVALDVSQIPFFTEANNPAAWEAVDSLARMLSNKVQHATSDQRVFLHLAAVFACNFSNHLLQIAQNILNVGGYDLEILKPLVDTTMLKAFEQGPLNAQTGPAVRGDTVVMLKHISMLQPQFAQVYRLLSNSILDTHHNVLRI